MIDKLLRHFREGFGKKHSVRHRAISGTGWLLLRSISIGGIDLIRTAVFTRVLLASDYGLLALATMGTGLLNAFSYLGLELLIQRDNDDFLSRFPVYWTIQAFRGVLLFLLSLVIASPLSVYYDQPRLRLIIPALGVIFLLQGFKGFGKSYCQRVMDFKRSTIFEVTIFAIASVFSLITLFAFKSYWALVANLVIVAIAEFTISYTLFPWRPRFAIDTGVLKSVLVFSSSIVTINILNYFFGNFDRATIGKLIDIDSVGYYARAHFLSIIPVTYLAMVISPVFMPTYREVSDDPQRLRRAFIKILMTYILIYSSIGCFLFLFSRQFILLVYGPKWLPILPIFRILIVFGASKGIVTVCPPLFFLKNKPWIITVSTTLMAAGFAASCVPATKSFGIEGTAWAVVVNAVVSHVFSILMALRILDKDIVKNS